jgi:hypothetical protein
MSNPLIQIDDEVREMTDEEYQEWLNREQTGLLNSGPSTIN